MENNSPLTKCDLCNNIVKIWILGCHTNKRFTDLRGYCGLTFEMYIKALVAAFSAYVRTYICNCKK